MPVEIWQGQWIKENVSGKKAQLTGRLLISALAIFNFPSAVRAHTVSSMVPMIHLRLALGQVNHFRTGGSPSS